VNENATQYVVDWILSNKAYFGANAVGTCLGMTSESGNTVYIFPSMLNQALTKAGYSPRKTMKYLAEQGLITTQTVDGKKRYSVIRRFGDRTCRFVEFYLGQLAHNRDPIDDEDEDPPSERETPGADYYQPSFEEIDGEQDEELPF